MYRWIFVSYIFLIFALLLKKCVWMKMAQVQGRKAYNAFFFVFKTNIKFICIQQRFYLRVFKICVSRLIAWGFIVSSLSVLYIANIKLTAVYTFHQSLEVIKCSRINANIRAAALTHWTHFQYHSKGHRTIHKKYSN